MWRVRRAVLVGILAGMMISSPLLVCCQEPGAAAPAPAGRSEKLDLGYVTPEATLAAVVQPRRVLTAPGMEMLPIEVISAAGKKELGFDPLQIEQIVLVLVAPQAGQPPQAGVAVRFAGPIDMKAKVLQELSQRTVEGDWEGKPYRKGAGPMDPSIFQPDERTLLVAHDGLLRSMVANRAKPAEGPVSRLLGAMEGSPDFAAALAFEPIRELLSAQLREVPPPFAMLGVDKIPDLVSSVEARVNLTGATAMSLTVRAKDEAAAKEL